MVTAMQAGESLRAVARSLRVSLRTVQRWVTRAGRRRLDRVDWADHLPVAHRVYRTPPEVEDKVLSLRRELRETSASQVTLRVWHLAAYSLGRPTWRWQP